MNRGGILPQRRVVIAAPEERVRRKLREGLASLGFVTWGEASDGLAALAQVRRARPHLVVLAPHLPSLDGAQVTESVIRSSVAPMILVQAEGAESEEMTVREESVCARLASPFSQRSLAEAVEVARSRFNRLAAIRNELRRLQRERAGRRLVERAKSLLVRRLMVGEPEAFWQIQQYCLEAEQPARAAVEAIIEASRLVLEG
jgi:two-component system, response regulator PdtaR